MSTHTTATYRNNIWRASFEFYPTPPAAVRALLSVESFDGDIWEPACGDWAISKVLIDAGHRVISTDLIERGYGQGGQDFLKSKTPLAKNIITNPPYGTHGLGDAFLRKAIIHCRQTWGSVAMLLNLRSLCNPDRCPRFQRCPPTAIYAIDQLTCLPYGNPVPAWAKINKQQYYWAVWHPWKVDRPTFWWLSVKDFK